MPICMSHGFFLLLLFLWLLLNRPHSIEMCVHRVDRSKWLLFASVCSASRRVIVSGAGNGSSDGVYTFFDDDFCYSFFIFLTFYYHFGNNSKKLSRKTILKWSKRKMGMKMENGTWNTWMCVFNDKPTENLWKFRISVSERKWMCSKMPIWNDRCSQMNESIYNSGRNVFVRIDFI